MAPSSVNPGSSQDEFSEAYRDMTNTAISWSTPEEWVLKLAQPISTRAYLMTPEE